MAPGADVGVTGLEDHEPCDRGDDAKQRQPKRDVGKPAGLVAFGIETSQAARQCSQD